jgi:GT2 family glycosyltransferase
MDYRQDGRPLNSMPLVYIITINWNRWQETLDCLSSVQKLIYTNFRIVVVDNNSDDDSSVKLQTRAAIVYDQATAELGGDSSDEALLRQLPSSEAIVLVQATTNGGFTGGCNIGIKYAVQNGADFVLLLNNDAIINSDAVNHLIETAAESGAGVVGARVFDKDGTHVLFKGRQWPEHIFGIVRVPSIRPTMRFWATGNVDGCAMLIRTALLRERMSQFGYFFDPAFFMYFEDVDLSLYANAVGQRCVVSRYAVVRHGLAVSSGGMYNPRSYYYLTRNRVRIANRWLAPHLRLLFHLYYMPSRLLILLRQLRHGRPAAARAIFWGLRDGYSSVTGRTTER